MKSYVCKSCGAELLLNDTSSFTTCLYCGNSTAITDKVIEDLNIKKIIPFTIDKEEAISNFKTILKKEIVEAKKIYVPVRYCNYEFDFLMYYEYVVHDSEDGDSYYDTEDLVDGNVTNEFVFNKSKINNVYFQEELRKQERVNFDPVLLKDVSIEYAPLLTKEELNSKINNDVITYSMKKMHGGICKIYTMNYYTSDLDIEPYTTLIPIYIVKTSDGIIYNLPGVKIDKKKIKFGVEHVILIAILIAAMIFLLAITKMINAYKTFSILNVLFFITAFIGIYLVIKNGIGNRLPSKTYDNFEFTKYSFGDHRKKIK